MTHIIWVIYKPYIMIYLFFEIVIDIDILCPLGTSIERFLVQVFARRTILFTQKMPKGAKILESIVFRTFDIEKIDFSKSHSFQAFKKGTDNAKIII